MDDYKSIFSKRAQEYHEAGLLYPLARVTERQILVDWLDVKEGQKICDIPYEQDKQSFFDETFRVLKPNGVIVVADVRVGSKAALWLNGPVDQYSSTGHKGLFLEDGEFSQYMRNSGFDEVDERYEEYTWNFPDWDALVLYCQKLFGLSKADHKTIKDLLKEHFGIVEEDQILLPWSLIYAKGVKK